MLRLRAAKAATSGQAAKDTSVILIWKGGGPSHIDMWDLKPQAPAEFRGEFQPIATNVPGIDISEHLPLSARQMDKYSIVRSVTHPDAGHESATPLSAHRLQADERHSGQRDAELRLDHGQGTRPAPARFAGLHRRAAGPAPQRRGLPGRGVQSVLGRRPTRATPNFSVRNLTLPNGISLDRLRKPPATACRPWTRCAARAIRPA